MFQTEYPFTLPKGYVDENGALHREGIMRLATAADEILPLSDPRLEKNPAYLLIILLSRVVIKLGQVKQVTPKTIEGLFSEDLTYLQGVYNQMNGTGRRPIAAVCPKCQHQYTLEANLLGELAATP
ncbi:MAG: hypothetical protein QM760_10785 [Nibricoccus sp.]